MPEAFISSTTSPGPGVGSGKLVRSRVRSPVKTTPRMVLSLRLAGEGRVVVDAAHAVDRLVVGPAPAGAVHDATGDLAGAIAFRLEIRADHHGRPVDLHAPFVGIAGAAQPHLEQAAIDPHLL